MNPVTSNVNNGQEFTAHEEIEIEFQEYLVVGDSTAYLARKA